MEKLEYEQIKNMVFLSNRGGFDIEATLECGQIFRFEKTGEKEYFLTAGKKGLSIKQEGDCLYFACDISEFEHTWLHFFDLRRNYAEIENTLAGTDAVMERAVAAGKGIRILNQDKTEMIISFIISQNKQIPGIKKILRDMCERYGEKRDGFYACKDGEAMRSPRCFYTFPDINTLARLDVLDFAALKAGFRARYLADAVKKIHLNEIDINPPDEKPTAKIREELMTIKGVGPKVADCVLLFSFGRRESFPVDVWVKRAVEELYFPGENKSLKEIEIWAREKFGAYGGYAQQYLFHYMRNRPKTTPLSF